MDKEKLIKSIMAEAEKDGEPVTREEAEEMAEMELKAKANTKHYEQSEKPRKKTTRTRKVDENKKHLLGCVKALFDDMGITIIDMKTETEIKFVYKGDGYTLKLTKHRPPKK